MMTLTQRLNGWQEAMSSRLLPLVILTMALFQMGRGPGNVAWGPLAIIGTVIVLANMRVLIEHRALSVSLLGFIAALLWGSLRFDQPANPVTDGWPAKYFFSIICSALVFFQLQLMKDLRPQDRNVSAYLALSAMVVVCLNLIYFAFGSDAESFDPAKQISATIAAVIAPWVFYHRDWSVIQKWSAIIFLMALLMLLDSRTEVLALLSAVCVYQSCCWRRLRWVLLLVPMSLLVMVGPELLGGASSFTEVGFENLNSVSSRRMEIWQSAWQLGQDKLWLGHGVYSSVRASFLPDDIRHVHNVFLEIFYETGLLGLACFCVFMFLAYWPLLRAYKEWSKPTRRLAAVVLAATTATLVVLFFDKSLHSVYARYYLFFLAGMAYWLARRERENIAGAAEVPQDNALEK